MEPRRVVSSAYSLIVLTDVSVDQRGCVTAGGRCTWIGNLDFEGVGCAGGSQVLDGRGEVVWTAPGTVTKAFHARAGDHSLIAGHGERQHIGSVKVEAGGVEVILELSAQGAIGGSGAKETEVAEAARDVDPAARSEEHTSELQSLAYLVCRLLLEKKKKQTMPLPRP